MSAPQSPCFKCPDRHFKCHSSCSRYIAFREELDIYNYRVFQEKELHTQEVAYALERAKRMAKPKK